MDKKELITQFVLRMAHIPINSGKTYRINTLQGMLEFSEIGFVYRDNHDITYAMLEMNEEQIALVAKYLGAFYSLLEKEATLIFSEGGAK